MDHSKFRILLKKFKADREKLEEYMEQDIDFKQLCREYQELGETIQYLQNLMNVPVDQIEKQIKNHKELFKELEAEIRLFLKNEN